MEELNLYDDLDEFQEQQEKKSKELQELENKYQQSLKTIEDLETENKTLKKSIKTIKLNFQSLLDTARAEIRRKNKEIDQLRKEKDDICFRRRPPHKVESQKRHLVSPENSTQSFKRQETECPESKEKFTPQGNETHDDKAENISKPVRDESFKRNRSQEGDHTIDNKRLKNSRDEKDYKYSHERHKNHYTDAYKNSRQSDERKHSHDRKKYESAERNHKTKSPERHRRPPSRSLSREHHRRDNCPERDKKTAHCEAPETSRPYNRSRSREDYKKHDKPELNTTNDNSNSSERSNSYKRQFDNSQNSDRYNFESRDRKEVNKYSKSTIKSPIGHRDLHSLNNKSKQENKAENKGEIKGGISDSAQNVSNQTETTENTDQETEKVYNNMTVNLTESDNIDSTNRGEEYEEQPYGHKQRNSDLKKIANSINSCVKDNKDDQDINIKISSEEDKTHNSDDLTTTTLKQPFVKRSSNENQFDKPSESRKRESLLTVEASKLGTPCKVALFNDIFGQHTTTQHTHLLVHTTTSSSTKSLFNNIKGLLANLTSNEVITTSTISSGDCTEASDCNETTKTKVCRDNISGKEIDKGFMLKQSKCSETTVKDLTKVMEDGIANEIQSVQIAGLDLCGESVIEKHEFKTTGTYCNKSLTELFTKESEKQRIVKESNERENDKQGVSENSLQMSAKLYPKDAEQQKEDSESKEIQSKAHTLLDNIVELEDINKNVKQKINLQMPSKQSVKDNEESNESKSHLVADNVTEENIQSKKRYEHAQRQTSLEAINKNVIQNLLDNEQPEGECADIQIESNFHLVGNKSHEFIKDTTPLEDTNENVEQKQTFTKKHLTDKKEPKRESEERKSVRYLEPVKDTTYLEDVNKTKQNNTLQEPTKQNLEGNEYDESVQIEINSLLVPENVTNSLDVKDKINVEVINQNTECIDKEKLPELKPISLIESRNENVTEKEQQFEKTQNILESIEGEVNTKQDDLLYTKTEVGKTSSQLNEVQISISNNRNDDLIVATEENTISNSSVLPVKSLNLTTTQENKEASTVSDVSHDKVNSAKIKNSDTKINNEISITDCRLKENKNKNLCNKQQNSAKCSDTNNDLYTNQVQETHIVGNIPREVKNNEGCNILNSIKGTNPIVEYYALENLESVEENRTEIANYSDKSNPTNCDTINTPLEKQNISEEITRSSKASDKPKDTDNDSNGTQIQEAHIFGNVSQDIEMNESLVNFNERKAIEPAEEQYSLENQNSSNEITECANAGDKPNDTGTDSDKTQVQEANISGNTISDVKMKESGEILSRIEGTKAADEQDLHENQKYQEIPRNAATCDKPQEQERFISESIPSVVKNSENRETLNRVEVTTSTDKQYPLENRDFSEEITKSASADNGSAKSEGQEAHLSGSALQEVENKEIIETDGAVVAIAAEAAQYSLENRDFSEEITKTATTSDEPNNEGNNSDKTQVQKVHISGSTLRGVKNNESIEINRKEVAKAADEQYPKTATTSDEPNDTGNPNKTPIKEHARITCESISQNVRSSDSTEALNRVKITKATDHEALVENQKKLLESGNKNVSEENETENTSHNDASLVLEKHDSPPLEPSTSDNLSHTVTCLRKTSLDLDSESYNLEKVAAELATTVSDGEQKSAGSESLELEPKLLTESAESIVQETEKEEIIILNKKRSTILTDKNDRITGNENRSKVQCEEAPLTSSVASEKGKDVLKGNKVIDIKTVDSLMNVKVTENTAKNSRFATISDPHTHSGDSSMDGTIKPNSPVDFTDQNQTSKIIEDSVVTQNKTSKESEEVLTSRRNESLVNIDASTSPKTFQHGLENVKKMISSTGHETNSTEAETKLLELNLKASSLPQKCTDKGDFDKTIACHTFNIPCTITSNSCSEKPSIPNIPDQLQNKTENIETAKQIEVIKKNISNSDKPSGIIAYVKRNENETITKQKSPGNIKSYPNPEILKVECSPSKRYQHEHVFQKISPALPDSFNTSPTLPSISTSSPTPSNFSGIFSKKSSHLSTAEEDFHKLKKKSLHFSTRPREFIIPAASVLCNVDNLENATKLNKKLHWELLDNKNELTEIEDDTDIETDEERHKFKGEIKQEQVTPQESPQQSPKDEQDEQSNPLYKADAVENSQELNYKAMQNMPPKIHKSKQYKYKLSKTIKSNPKSAKVNIHDSVTHCSVIEQKPFSIVLPKRQRGRPRKLENLLKATIKAKAGPRILKKRGRKPKKPIEFTESYDNNSTECAEPVIDVVSPKDKIADTLVSEGECALNVKQNEELLAEAPMDSRKNCDVILRQEEENSIQSSCKLNDENKQQISLENRNLACFTRDQIISNEPVIKDVLASTNKGCDDTGKSLQISTKDGQNSNPESKKISKESDAKMSANKPVTFPLNNDNNCDYVSTTSGDSENKLLILSDGGPEEINEKQTEVRPEEKVSSTKSKPLGRLEERKSASTKKDKKYISLEDIGIKVRHFKGHLSTLRIPKVNKDADQTNAWKLEAYEELDKQQWEEKVEQKIESEMNGSKKTVKTANKSFLSTYRIPKIKRDAGLCKDNLKKTETSCKMPKEAKREKVKESYHENVNKNVESKDKLSNNSKVSEAESIDKTKHSWRTDNAVLKEKFEKCKKSHKQQRENECDNAGSNIINFDNKAETGKRKLFNLETYNDVDHEDKIENAEVNKQTGVCTERKLSEPKVSEKESSCYTGKPVKLRRKSLNLPRKMVVTSSDEEEAKHLENVDVTNPLERNVLHTRKKASLHRRILDSSCDEDVEVLGSNIKEKLTNKTNKPLKERRKSMFVESTTFETDFHHNDERLSDKKLTSKNLVQSTSCSETFDSEKNVDLLSSNENINCSLKIRRQSLFIESSTSKTTALGDTKLAAHMKPRKDDDNMLEPLNDSIKEHTIKNKNDNIELKCTKLLKSRRKSMHVEPDCARDQTTSINEASKKEISINEPFDRENAAGIKTKSTKRDLKEVRSNSNEHVNKEIEVGPIREQNKKDEPVNTNEITKDLSSSMEQFPLKPRRKSINHRRILDSSSDDNEPLMKKPLLIVNEIKAPVASTELKTKPRKRRVVKVLSTSRDAINSSANSSLHSENLTQIHSNSPSPFASPLHNHPIFNREVSTQSREFVASMPVTPNQQDDDKKFKEIDSKLHQIFRSPQYTTDYKTNHNTTTDSNIMEMLSTSLPPDAQGKNVTAEVFLDPNRENDKSSANVVINKPGQLPHTTTVDSIKLDMLSTSLADSEGMDSIPREIQPDINQENNQSSVNRAQINESSATLNNTTVASHNCSEIKHLSLGSAEYRFEKVSDNVVNLFISRKRKRKRLN